MGVIDTLSEGFRLVFRRPWLALLPVLVDLSVWRAPKLSISPIVSQLIGWLNGMAGALASTGGADPDAVTALVQTLEETTARTNLIGLIASSRLGISAISAALPIEVGDRIIELSQLWQMAFASLALVALGILIGTAYLLLIAQSIRDEPIALAPFVRVLFRSWASLALISLVIGCAFVSAVLASSLVGIFAVFALLALGWALLYASFFPQAVTLAGHKPLNAVLSSLLVVRSSLWPTLGLLVLVNLLDTGLSLIWYRAIGSSSVVTFVAILASAFVGTGLTAALFYFYRDRSAALRSLIMAQGKT